MDTAADNFNDYDGDGYSNALTGVNKTDVNTNDTTLCIYYGCTDSLAFNFEDAANTNDGSCVAVSYGCTDTTYVEYTATANTDTSGFCINPIVLGCTDEEAFNYRLLPTPMTDLVSLKFWVVWMRMQTTTTITTTTPYLIFLLKMF